MKKTFPGYFALTDAEFKELWGKCIFCIDANILLNLYRYSKETRKEFLDLLKSIKNSLWIPHQAANEYLENRLGVISEQRKAYDKMIADLTEIVENFKDVRRHPFIEPTLLVDFNNIYDKVINNLEVNMKEHDSQLDDDIIQTEIISLLKNRVGSEYPVADLKVIYKEGEERYKYKIPPGFKDIVKGIDANPIKIYGDLIIWKQILDKAKKDKINIIFITDDKKEDWWRIFNGKTIGPRPELIKEFQQQTNQMYYMYQPDQFMEFANKHLSKTVKAEAIKEVKDIRKESERLSGFKSMLPHVIISDYKKRLDRLKNENSAILMRKEQIEHLLDSIKANPSYKKTMEPFLDKELSETLRREIILMESIKNLQNSISDYNIDKNIVSHDDIDENAQLINQLLDRLKES